MNMGYVHTFAEMNHWHAEELHAANWSWLDPKNLRATKNDVGLWYAAMELIKLCEDVRKRRSLWNWSIAKAGGRPFAQWCRNVEHIQPMTGDWRRKAGIECIALAFDRKLLQHNEIDAETDLIKVPEIRDKETTIRVMRLDDAKPMACDFDRTLERFDWAETQNARRRQREAQARKRQAA
jgi:hypothetical protein